MNKFNLFLFYPIIINIMIMIILMSPSKLMLNPMFMMILLFMYTCLTTIKINYMYKSWFPFILYLIIIGGLMVIFMYIMSLMNNMKFPLKFKSLTLNLIKILPMISLMIFLFSYDLNMIFFNLNNQFTWNSNFFTLWDQTNMNFMYTNFFNKSTLFIMLYLYYTMICVMSICIKYKIPLRQNLFYE